MYLRNFCALIALAFLATINTVSAQQAPESVPQPQQTPSQTAIQPEVRSVQYQDWSYRCLEVKAADNSIVPNCEVAQVAQVKQGDKDVNVLTLAIARTVPDPAKKQAAGLLLTALVPLNVFLPSGFMIDVDNISVSESSYRNCNESGCWIQQKLDTKVVAALQKGASGGARLRLMNGQNVNIKFSLKGLTDALTALQKPAGSE
jgi:invasion protein IalB